MANAQVNIRFIENSRGGQTLVHNDFLFCIKTRKSDSLRCVYYCVNKECGARLNTKDERSWSPSFQTSTVLDQIYIRQLNNQLLLKKIFLKKKYF